MTPCPVTPSEKKLTFIRFSHFKMEPRSDKKRPGEKYRFAYDVYLCGHCGKEKIIRRRQVMNKKIKSCGCLRRENAKKMMKWIRENKLNPGGSKPRPGWEPKNKGKIFLPDRPGRPHRGMTGRYVTEGELAAMYHGIEGEVTPL